MALDWGSAGAADSTAAAWGTTSRKNKAPTTAAAGGNSAFPGSGRADGGDGDFFLFGGGGDGRRDGGGVSGEEAMAQALIAGRAEQAYLEDRLKVNEHRLEGFRGEALRLRAVLERWHGDFVLPAAAAQVCVLCVCSFMQRGLGRRARAQAGMHKRGGRFWFSLG